MQRSLATSEGQRWVPSGRPCWPARWPARPATKLCPMIIPRDIFAPNYVPQCGWIQGLIGRVSAREKWRLKEMIVDFCKADLGCVQWCQIGLGKGARVDHIWSTPFISDRGSFPKKDLKPSLLAAQNLAGFDPATNFRMLFFIAELVSFFMSDGEEKKKNIPNKRTNKICQKTNNRTPVLHYIYIATNKRTFFYPRLIFRDTRVVDVILMRFATNLLKPWVTIVHGLFLYL